MPSLPRGSLLALALGCALALPAEAAGKGKPRCPADQVALDGRCVAACPAEGVFAASEPCECSRGQGKLLLGSGGARCDRLLCRAGVVDPALCACPEGTEMKAAGKGKGRCVAARRPPRTAAATPEKAR